MNYLFSPTLLQSEIHENADFQKMTQTRIAGGERRKLVRAYVDICSLALGTLQV